jgi:subtilisin family serine protease
MKKHVSLSKKMSLLVFIFILPLTLYSNCTAPGSSYQQSSYFPGAINTGSSTTPQCQAQINRTRVSSKISRELASHPTELVAVLDNACVQSTGGLSTVTRTAIAKGLKTELQHAAYQIQLPSGSESIQTMMLADRCIHSLNAPNKYRFVSTLGSWTRILATSPQARADSTTPSDPYYFQQSHLPFIGFPTVYPYLYNSYNGIQKPVRIAIVDSGIDMQHPDLMANLFTTSSGAVSGYDATTGTIGTLTDSSFHGTHVAGLAAAITNNGVGVSGVAGENVQILAIKVGVASGNLLEPTINLDDLINGIHWGAEQSVDVMNISIGGQGSNAGPPGLEDAINYAVQNGVTVFVAAGNGDPSTGIGIPIDNVNPYNEFYPASWGAEVDGLVSVASVDVSSNSLSSFSNYSPSIVTLASPGSNGSQGILSTIPSSLATIPYASTLTGTNSSGQLETIPIQGTSMASPVAAGSAALAIGMLRSRGFKPTPSQVKLMMSLGSQQNTALASYVLNGNVLNLNSLIAFIDQQTHVSSQSQQLASTAYGTISISTQPASAQVDLGASASLTVSLSSSSTIFVQYQWYHNGIAISGATSAQYSVSSMSSSDLGSYDVMLTAGTTKVTSATATLSTTGVTSSSSCQ